MKRLIFDIVMLLGLVLALLSTVTMGLSAAGEPVTAVPAVDLTRYLGKWYEISRYENWFQKSCAGDVSATYASRPDGQLDVMNVCRTANGSMKTANGLARVVDQSSRAKLKVRFAPAFLSFLPMVWGDYWVLGLADDYSWSVVGTPDRKYLWILSRTPVLGESQMSAVLGVVRAQGFDPQRLQPTSQKQ
jgi:apolipoprotein D and lipocalin family protein